MVRNALYLNGVGSLVKAIMTTTWFVEAWQI